MGLSKNQRARHIGQEEEWGTPSLCGLQETERRHEERLLSTGCIDDNMDTLAGAKRFSTTDLKSGYGQVDVTRITRRRQRFRQVKGYVILR
jgi:hypothetical protein